MGGWVVDRSWAWPRNVLEGLNHRFKHKRAASVHGLLLAVLVFPRRGLALVPDVRPTVAVVDVHDVPVEVVGVLDRVDRHDALAGEVVRQVVRARLVAGGHPGGAVLGGVAPAAALEVDQPTVLAGAEARAVVKARLRTVEANAHRLAVLAREVEEHLPVRVVLVVEVPLAAFVVADLVICLGVGLSGAVRALRRIRDTVVVRVFG